MIKRFKNRNISIRLDKEQLKKPNMILDEFLYEMYDEGIEPIGDTFCLSNFATGQLFYDINNDVKFIVNWVECDELIANGKTMKLYASELDEDDREYIDEYMQEYA